MFKKGKKKIERVKNHFPVKKKILSKINNLNKFILFEATRDILKNNP